MSKPAKLHRHYCSNAHYHRVVFGLVTLQIKKKPYRWNRVSLRTKNDIHKIGHGLFLY